MNLTFELNAHNSQYSYPEVERIVNQCFAMVEHVCGHTFTTLVETDKVEGDWRPGGIKVIRFRPRGEFSNPGYLALAAQGIKINAWTTRNFGTADLRRLIYHELGHNLRLKHVYEPNSIMTQDDWRSLEDWGLLWRKDLQILHRHAPITDVPQGYISVDEDLNVMIPSIDSKGSQWGVQLRVYSPGVWMVDKRFKDTSGYYMEPHAVLTNNEELHLTDVDWLGTIVDHVKFSIDERRLLRLI